MSNTVSNKVSFSWRAIDLVTGAIFAVALGVAFWGFDILYYAFSTPITTFFSPINGLFTGFWILPAVAGMLLVRRPGAALFVELIAANVELTLGNTWGVTVIVSALLQAAGVEIVFAIFRYRRFNFGVAAIAGALSAVFEIVGYELYAYYPHYSPINAVIHVVLAVISGTLVAGGLGSLLIRGLAKTGALNAFAVGREARSK